MSDTAAQLLADLEGRLRPLELEVTQSWWTSSTHSSDEANRRRSTADLAYRSALADPAAFAAVTEAAAAHRDDDEPLVGRQLDLLRRTLAVHQFPDDLRRRIIDLETAVDATFTTFRGEIDGQPADDNVIADVLRTSDDPGAREQAWRASKQIGAEVAEQVRELTRLRNEAARQVGARDYFALSLSVGEMDEDRLFALLDEVERATVGPFRAWKGQLDGALADRFSCAVGELRPWHLDDPFFQDPPIRGSLDLDPLFAPCDLEELTLRTYDAIGLEIRPVLANSDLYARPAKSQHAFCIDLDREGDVRVLANVVPNERWMGTMLHEFGHGTYDREIRRDLPWFLREPAHALTTEGIAMLFGRLSRDPQWLRHIAGIEPGTVDRLHDQLIAAHRANLLTFARWVLVVTHFERALYADPERDLDTLWWDLVERYQGVYRPDGRHAPDWAAKIHLAAVPVYYQNYLYGELVASQLTATIDERAGGLVGHEAAGRFLVDEVFAPGASLRWDRLVERATGTPLTAAYLARELTGS